MEEDRPEDWTLVHLLTGGPVFVEYLAGRAIENDAALERVQAGEVLKGLSEARTQRFFLHSYYRYGIDVRSESDSKDDRFISWGAILSIWGPSREELIRGHREAMQRQEDSEGSEPL